MAARRGGDEKDTGRMEELEGVSGVLCDRRMLLHAMMYGMEATPIKKVNEKRMNMAEMKMLRWMSGVTRRDSIPNTRIRGTVEVAELSKKVQKARLRWYGHVLRRDEEVVERRMMDMEVHGRRGRGRPKTRWKDSIAADVREKQLDLGMVHNRNDWRQLIKNSDPI